MSLKKRKEIDMIDSQSNQQLIDAVYEKVKDQLELQDDITLDDDLSLFGLNSLSSVNLIVELEEMFVISFADTSLLLSNFSSIRKIVEQIKIVL